MKAEEAISLLTELRQVASSERIAPALLLRSPEMIAALDLAIMNLSGLTGSRAGNMRPKKGNAGKLWSSAEDELLAEGFDSGKNIEALSHELGRSPFSIKSRLEKLGRVIEQE